MAPWAKRRSETEQRKRDCELLYDLEVASRKVGWGDPTLIYDERKSRSGSWTAASLSPESTPTGTS